MTTAKPRRRSAARSSRMASPTIELGTSGWRGVLGEEVTYPRLRALVDSVAIWLGEQPSAVRRRRVLVGYDGRFASRHMAELAARILHRHGLVPVVADRVVPTPVLSALVVPRRALGAVVLTASHNPPEYHGLKVFREDGGGIGDRDARRLERLARRALARASEDSPPAAAPARTADLTGLYLERLLQRIDVGAVRRARPRVWFDAMHGAASGVLDEALRRCGAAVEGLRLDLDPRFGGGTPDPLAHRLGRLRSRVRAGRGLRLGLATDGDGDRLAAVDEAGRVLTESQILALLVDHLAASGRLRRGVAISLATGSLVERVAAHHGLPVRRFPMGFKHLSAALASGEADAAGDESGGFAWASMGRDKDGIAAGCLLVELMASERAPVGRRLARLERSHGRWSCGRRALAGDSGCRAALERIRTSPPSRIDGSAVRAVQTRDGLHLQLEDGFLMWRASGTEPVLRVYAEAPGPGRLKRRLDQGERVLARAAPR